MLKTDKALQNEEKQSEVHNNITKPNWQDSYINITEGNKQLFDMMISNASKPVKQQN